MSTHTDIESRPIFNKHDIDYWIIKLRHRDGDTEVYYDSLILMSRIVLLEIAYQLKDNGIPIIDDWLSDYIGSYIYHAI